MGMVEARARRISYFSFIVKQIRQTDCNILVHFTFCYNVFNAYLTIKELDG